jgi:mRNA-degrading endonuclease RelE of RelBE toxin-antitoxin system
LTGCFKIKIDVEALNDIQEATDWYNRQLQGLGGRFQKQVKQQINSLRESPFQCPVRYAGVRCMVIRKFPFLVHYTVDEPLRTVSVHAVYHTSRNPKIWIQRKDS